VSIQINYQGREFVNQISDRLHEFTGKKQRVHFSLPPSKQWACYKTELNHKNMILKTLYNENFVDRWPDIIDAVLFAHRTVLHESTKYSPFFCCIIVNQHYS